MLNRYRKTKVSRKNVPIIIENELRNMRKAYGGKTFLSALTKAFWMMKRHPVVIYDSNARKGLWRYGLLPGYKDYSVYFDSWFKFFERDETRRGLDDALAWLAKNSVKKISLQELNSDWFRNRVTDMRLFYVGKRPSN